ncbi:MAG: FAD:protein FMN transferase [Gammaproteobacteria bacterium]|nr:FAD:protein FMN transferase [Gammaproteobacteria bacterium]
MTLPARLVLLILLFGLPFWVQAEWHNAQRDIMGTRISLDTWHADATRAAECANRVFEELRRIEVLMSTYIATSEISRINADAAVSSLEISPELAGLIEKSLYFSDISGGAFDITYASVGYAYDYRNKQQPDDEALARALPAIDYRHVELDGNRIRFRHAGVRIDLGGIAKGYAVDRGVATLASCGISRAMLSAGGDSRIIGDRGGHPWVIGIQHPRDPEAIALRVPLSDTAVSTSGDYERFFFADGERVHHILNPKTGKSAEGSWSATVTGPDAMTTDALSTTLFVLGAVEGIALIESLEGFDAIVIDHHGKVHYSSGFKEPESES